MSTRSATLRNTAFSSIGMYTEYLLGMVTSVVIARHLGPDGFGVYGLLIWLVAMGVATANSGTASSAIKFVAELRGVGQEQAIPSLLAYLRRQPVSGGELPDPLSVRELEILQYLPTPLDQR